MWVKDYMFKDVHTIAGETTIREAVKVMVENKTNSLIVVDGRRKPLGTLSSYTLVRQVVPAYLGDDPVFSQFGAEGTFDKYAEKFQDTPVRDIMHTSIHILKINDTMIEAASYSIAAERRILPVVDESGVLIGAVTRTCLKNALHDVYYKKGE